MAIALTNRHLCITVAAIVLVPFENARYGNGKWLYTITITNTITITITIAVTITIDRNSTL